MGSSVAFPAILFLFICATSICHAKDLVCQSIHVATPTVTGNVANPLKDPAATAQEVADKVKKPDASKLKAATTGGACKHGFCIQVLANTARCPADDLTTELSSASTWNKDKKNHMPEFLKVCGGLADGKQKKWEEDYTYVDTSNKTQTGKTTHRCCKKKVCTSKPAEGDETVFTPSGSPGVAKSMVGVGGAAMGLLIIRSLFH